MARILLVEDDLELAFIVEQSLTSQNHIVDSVADGEEGLNFILYNYYDLAVLDWDVPSFSGLDILNRYRENGGKMPILFLTGKTDIKDKVRALDVGADDYICKPFTRKEFLARIKAILRRVTVSDKTKSIFKAGKIELDQENNSVTIGGIPADLSRSEFTLLELLIVNKGQVFSHEQIIDKVFKRGSDTSKKSVRQLVTQVRKKIDENDKDSLIITLKGIGYKLEIEG